MLVWDLIWKEVGRASAISTPSLRSLSTMPKGQTFSTGKWITETLPCILVHKVVLVLQNIFKFSLGKD